MGFDAGAMRPSSYTRPLQYDHRLSNVSVVITMTKKRQNKENTLQVRRQRTATEFYCIIFNQPVRFKKTRYKSYVNYTPRNAVMGGGGILDSPCLSVCLSVCPSVRLSVCPLTFRVRPVASTVQDGFFPYLVQMINSMRRMWWPLTLTYIFKVIRPWLRKLCPLCSIYSSAWILSIFGANDH